MSESNTNENTITELKILAAPTIIIGLIVLLIPFGIWNAFVVLRLYNWFLLPLHAPSLNLWHIWGILLIYNYLKPTPKSEPNWVKNLLADTVKALLSGGLALLIGYILVHFI